MASKITVGKIVANATETEWSQAYHAGGFTAVVSLQSDQRTVSEEKESTLHAFGKALLDTLVSEYFTLTTKDLETVRSAVLATIEKAPKHMQASLIVAAVVKNVLYVVIANEGEVLLKRGTKLGKLLEVKPEDTEKIASVSGFLEANDLILLYTQSFAQIFPHDELETAFENKTAEELAEYFAPKVHGTQNGSASALVFSYHEDESPFIEPAASQTREEEKLQEKTSADLPGFATPMPGEKPKLSFSHRQKLFLTITIILGLVLIGSIVIFQFKQIQAKQQALFASVYQPAKTKFDEAQGLLDLNKSLAIEDLQSVQDMLSMAKTKFPADSPEEKQILSLLSQTTSSLENAKKIPVINASKAPDNASPFLTFVSKHDGEFVAQDSSSFYTADATGITQYGKSDTTGKLLIKNANIWKSLGGFGTYLGNFYVLDTTDGITKFVGTSGGDFGQSAYFPSGASPDLSKAVGLTIDGSIWIISSNGSIAKYTKGKQDIFTINGLDKPITSPSQILTTVDFDNVYILDKGNGRIVVLKKDGSFVAQYSSDTVRTTALMDISEKDKKIYLLSSGSIYSMDLK